MNIPLAYIQHGKGFLTEELFVSIDWNSLAYEDVQLLLQIGLDDVEPLLVFRTRSTLVKTKIEVSLRVVAMRMFLEALEEYLERPNTVLFADLPRLFFDVSKGFNSVKYSISIEENREAGTLLGRLLERTYACSGFGLERLWLVKAASWNMEFIQDRKGVYKLGIKTIDGLLDYQSVNDSVLFDCLMKVIQLAKRESLAADSHFKAWFLPPGESWRLQAHANLKCVG